MKRCEMVLEEFGDNVIIEAEDMADAARQVADAVEFAFGFHPVITDEGSIRWHHELGELGYTTARVFEGEPEFDYDEWDMSPNWAQVIEEVKNQ